MVSFLSTLASFSVFRVFICCFRSVTKSVVLFIGKDNSFDNSNAISFIETPVFSFLKISAVVFSKIKYLLELSDQAMVLSSSFLYKKSEFFFIK